MLHVLFHFRADLDLVEIWPDDTTRHELQERALAVGAVCYTPTIAAEQDVAAE